MTYDVEIVLRDHIHAVRSQLETLHEPADWNEADVAQVLESMLLAIDRVRNPGTDRRYVALRGFSWIVEPTGDGVVIAIEIPTGAAVAGPFKIARTALDGLITRVLAAVAPPPRTVVH
jgi:hypothetical protein